MKAWTTQRLHGNKIKKTYFLICCCEALFAAQFVYHLRHANNIARSIFDRHAEKSFGSVSSLYINLTVKTLILQGKESLLVIIKHLNARWNAIKQKQLSRYMSTVINRCISLSFPFQAEGENFHNKSSLVSFSWRQKGGDRCHD